MAKLLLVGFLLQRAECSCNEGSLELVLLSALCNRLQYKLCFYQILEAFYFFKGGFLGPLEIILL